MIVHNLAYRFVFKVCCQLAVACQPFGDYSAYQVRYWDSLTLLVFSFHVPLRLLAVLVQLDQLIANCEGTLVALLPAFSREPSSR